AKVLTIPCGSRRNYVNKSDWWEIFLRDSGFVQQSGEVYVTSRLCTSGFFTNNLKMGKKNLLGSDVMSSTIDVLVFLAFRAKAII
ncbi:MAG: hypothetical protein COW70_00005, partial [Hydrogenophilales bacterium CG18_big_fil_WC_8_21_14_2_50_58_12]